jgi:hypothetical protein
MKLRMRKISLIGKIVIIQPVIRERGGENPKTAQKFYFC